MSKTENNERAKVASKLAAALARNGVTSDAPEEVPNHWLAAERVYLLSGVERTKGDWKKLLRAVQTKEVTRFHFHHKMASICQFARSHPDLEGSEIEQLTFAWGYFTAKAKVASAGTSDDVVNT